MPIQFDISGLTYRPERLIEALPTLIPMRQRFDGTKIYDVPSSVRESLMELKIEERIESGDRIILTAGSRGISCIPQVLHEICNYLKACKAEPVILGSMGSHGGDTVEGQREVLASLGITEESMGAKIVTSTDAVSVGETSKGYPVYCDPIVLESKGLLVVNRIKAHTTMSGRIESGIHKMMVVGLGHRLGAESFHSIEPLHLVDNVIEAGQILMKKTPFMGALGVVENAFDEPALIEAMSSPEEVEVKERELLKRAKEWMPGLPFSSADALIVQKMGKNYSGTGLDTNVIGRIRVQYLPDSQSPIIKKIAVLDLTEESHGNATGLGLADFITERFIEKVHLESTYINVFTSTLTMRGMIPIIMREDLDAICAAIKSSNPSPNNGIKLAVIQNTLELERLWVTPSLLEEIPDSSIKELGEEEKMLFSEKGDLILD